MSVYDKNLYKIYSYKNTNSNDNKIGVGVNSLLDIFPIYATILSDFNPLEKVYFLENSFSVLKKQRIKYL